MLQFLSAQAVFKDSREVLLKMGAMRFVESLVTARPMAPARGLQVTNDQHSFAFKFGVGDESSGSSTSSKKGNSIVPLALSAFDSRAADGQLCMFQSTPAGERSRSLLHKHQTHHRNKHTQTHHIIRSYMTLRSRCKSVVPSAAAARAASAVTSDVQRSRHTPLPRSVLSPPQHVDVLRCVSHNTHSPLDR